jgi:hypothetical protein
MMDEGLLEPNQISTLQTLVENMPAGERRTKYENIIAHMLRAPR